MSVLQGRAFSDDNNKNACGMGATHTKVFHHEPVTRNLSKTNRNKYDKTNSVADPAQSCPGPALAWPCHLFLTFLKLTH